MTTKNSTKLRHKNHSKWIVVLRPLKSRRNYGLTIALKIEETTVQTTLKYRMDNGIKRFKISKENASNFGILFTRV